MVEMSITNYLISFGNFSNADYVRRLNEQVSSTAQQVKSEISTSTVSFFKAPNFLLLSSFGNKASVPATSNYIVCCYLEEVQGRRSFRRGRKKRRRRRVRNHSLKNSNCPSLASVHSYLTAFGIFIITIVCLHGSPTGLFKSEEDLARPYDFL